MIVVEHDEDAMHAADTIIDVGPGAGLHGGEIVAMGNAKHIAKHGKSLTADYLSGRQFIAPPSRKPIDESKKMKSAVWFATTLKTSTAIPVGLFTIDWRIWLWKIEFDQ